MENNFLLTLDFSSQFIVGIIHFLTVAMGERNGAVLALCLILVGQVASENLAIFAANVLGIFIVRLLKKCPR